MVFGVPVEIPVRAEAGPNAAIANETQTLAARKRRYRKSFIANVNIQSPYWNEVGAMKSAVCTALSAFG
jgi:hypothetical protein